MKYYEAVTWRNKIESFDVERVTDSSVFIKGQRRKKKSVDRGFYESFEQAKDFLIDHYEAEVSLALSRLDYAKQRLDIARNLSEGKQNQ